MADITATDLANLHKVVQERFKIDGGMQENRLDAIAHRPNEKIYGQESYNDIFFKAASIMEGIIRQHPFTDGNKRTALIATSVYLDINGYTLILPLSAVRFTVKIAKNKKIDSKSNAKLIKKIAKWIERYSARKYDKEAIRQVFKDEVGWQYQLLLLIGKTGILAKISRTIVRYWLAIDIYPQYEKETIDIAAFLTDLLRRNIGVNDPSSAES